MSQMKRFAEKVSCEMGFCGELTDVVLKEASKRLVANMAGNIIQHRSRKSLLLETIGHLIDLDPEIKQDQQRLAAAFNILSNDGRRAEIDKEVDDYFKIIHGCDEETCARCGSSLTPQGFCVDETCPFSEWVQDDARGWANHPEAPEWARR